MIKKLQKLIIEFELEKKMLYPQFNGKQNYQNQNYTLRPNMNIGIWNNNNISSQFN